MAFKAWQAVLISLVAVLIPFYSLWVRPTLDILGTFRKPENFNTERCKNVPELVACEDQYILRSHGLSWLPCSAPTSRMAWTPAVLLLNASQLPDVSQDHLKLYDLRADAVSSVSLSPGSPELFVHGIDAHVHPPTPGAEAEAETTKLTFFLNSHRPPANRSAAPELGAESVVELFETSVGGEGGGRGEEWTHVGTVSHPLINTPNNLVVVGERQFFVTNDHAEKVHPMRHHEAYIPRYSTVVYCDAADLAAPDCKVAASGINFPNGIAKGPDNTLYVATTLGGVLLHYSIHPDHTLTLLESIKLPRPMDNLHVTPGGGVYIATFANIMRWVEITTAAGQAAGKRSPTEVWRLVNDTTPAGEHPKLKGWDGTEARTHAGIEFVDHHLRLERVLADDGGRVSGPTSAAPFEGKMYLTGLFNHHLTVCEMPPDFDM